MEIKLAMLIMGSVLIILGVVKNIIPVKFNEGIFGKIEGEAVFLNDQQAKFQFPNGETVNASSKAGQVMWSPAVKHLPENIGDETLELIQVEIK